MPSGINLLKGKIIKNGGIWTGGFYGANKKGNIKWENSEDKNGKSVKITGRETGVRGFITLKNMIPVTPGESIYFNYTGKYSSDTSSAQIRFYDAQNKEIGKYLIIPKATPEQWFILSKIKCTIIFMERGNNGSYKNGNRTRYKSVNLFIVPSRAVKLKVYFFSKGISAVTIKNVVLLKKILTAEEKNIREEQKRLQLKLNIKKGVKRNNRTPGFTVTVDKVELSPVKKVLPDGWPVPAVSVKNGTFQLNNRPAYLFGVESNATMYPFLYKLLGMDFIQYTTPYLTATVKVKHSSKNTKFSWTKPLDLPLGVKDLLSNGFLPYIQMIEPKSSKLNRKFKLNKNTPDMLVDFGHFYSLRHDNADAWLIRKNYLKNNLAALTKYPIFAIETFNEVLFIDGGPEAVKRFRSWCKKKYGTLEKLNDIWKTKFTSFSKICPPKVEGWTYSFATLPDDISRMMWYDWGVFSSYNSQAAFRKTYDLVKHYRPDALVTVQSHVAHFYDHVFCGINAQTKSKAEDIYGDESSIIYTPQIFGRENPIKISEMLRGVLWIDYLANLLPEKTQMSEEGSAHPGYIDLNKQTQAQNLHDGNWKFMPDNANTGTSAGYFLTQYNDSSWKKIMVPDMWANQGYGNVIQGWYRRSITLSEDILKQALYLNGTELAAICDIYINGKLVHSKKKTDDRISNKINSYLTAGKNTLAIKLRDSYFKSGYYWGGIRGRISLDFVPQEKSPINFGQIRSYFWERMLHGESGSVFSYAYMPEGTHNSLFKKVDFHALKAFPQVKNEIKNCSDIVLKKKLRLNARIALCYPQETMRYHIAKRFSDASKGPLEHDVLTWYSALIGTGVPTAVIPNSRLLDPNINEYKLIFMQGNERVPMNTIEALKKYVKNGGILVLDGASLQREDDFDKKINKSKITGCTIAKTYSDVSSILSYKKSLLTPRLRDGITGWDVKAKSAKILLKDNKKRPILLKNQYGKGKIYTVAANPDGRTLIKMFTKLLAANAERADIDFQAKQIMPWIERYLLGNNGKYVIYLHNWGGGAFEGKVKINKALTSGKYTVRNIQNGKILLQNVDANSIMKNGIKCSLSSQDPLVLLLENTPPRKLVALSEEQNKWLDYIVRKPLLNIPDNKRIMIYSGGIVTYSRIRLLTAAYLLEQNGFECVAGLSTPIADTMQVYNGGLKKEELNSFGIIFIGGNRGGIKPSEIKLLKQYVENGGSLFFCGSWSRSLWLKNRQNNKLMKQFGANILDYSYIDSKKCVDNISLYPIFTNLKKDDSLTENVNTFVSHGMAVVQVNHDWRVVVPGLAQCTNKKLVSRSVKKVIGKSWRAAAIAVRKYGKGKVVICGDPSWLEGKELDRGDNRKLFLNLVTWLSKN